jgi:galactose mutarotase-like enzyme
METFSYKGCPCQRWRRGASTFVACMERGARLMRWELDLPQGKREVVYWPDEVGMDDIAGVRGGNPVLFPFTGRNYAGGEKFFWRDTEGVKRQMPLHGWARQGRFEITAAGEAFVEARFLPDAAAREGYAYDYAFCVRLAFEELSLGIDFSLTNNDSRNIPWCAGHHFYFGLPWHAGLSREDYVLRVPAKKLWRHSAAGKLVPVEGVTPPLSFGDPAASDLIYTKLKSNAVSFGPRNGEEDVTLLIGEEPVPDAWTTLVSWTSDAASPFYCVEPWMGPPNSHEHKNGLRWVAPGKTETFPVRVSLA